MATATQTALKTVITADNPADGYNTPEDRRSMRSKRMLREAFAQLIEECGLDGFSISDLTERADLNRGTFYAHYKDKDDLLHCSENEIIDSLGDFERRMKEVTLRELLTVVATGRPPYVAVELFDVLREHGVLLRVLLGPRGDAAFQVRLRELVCANLVRGVLHQKYRDNPTPLVEYYVSYYASAHLGLLQRWLERGMAETSEEMARIMVSIMFLKPGDPIELKGKNK
ncbi:MAG: TetR/AcrR family transcriptional regulator [Coriobacteriales bacterium]|jgi:AcrR family transcriptional regulator|nr:TetR/AcrR family transcriptional regulator [Coriobacteriales bacterium]